MKYKLNKRDSGFTIIEVIIVLAIAALIMLVVFLAVPALQRSQRNNARKTDVNRFSASIIGFVASNNNAAPTTSNLATIITDVGKMGGYPDPLLNGAAVAANNSLSLVSGVQAALATTLTNAVQIVTGAKCSAAGATVASTGQIAIQYTLETSAAGTSTVWCQNIQ